MMFPGITLSPPNFFTPRYFGLESRPFFVDPAVFFVAQRLNTMLSPPDVSLALGYIETFETRSFRVTCLHIAERLIILLKNRLIHSRRSCTAAAAAAAAASILKPRWGTRKSGSNPRTPAAMSGEEAALTAQETALYDRQIRVWGVDAQKRLSKAHVLVYGLSGTAVEFCKNIVLAGVGSLTLIDDRMVTENVLQANFLFPPDESKYNGRCLAELCCDSLRDFNPMVHVSVEKGDLSQFDEEFFDKFDAVVVSCCSFNIKKAVNEKCRKRPKRVAFYSVECRNSCGEIFVDLQSYTYAQKKCDETAECHLCYPSLEEAVSVCWRDLPRRTAKLYFAMRVIERFELSEGRRPGEIFLKDLPSVLRLRKELCEAQKLDESHIPAELLEQIVAAGTEEHPPVCAILGGILGQEVIKAISGKGTPLKNFFYFDIADGKGVIQDISKPSPHVDTPCNIGDIVTSSVISL